MANTLSFQTTAMPGGGGGGLGLNFNLGPSTAQLAQQSFNFLNGVNSTDQGFLNSSISSSQNFMSAQLQPLTSALANSAQSLNQSIMSGNAMNSAIAAQLPGITQWVGNQIAPAVQNQNVITAQTMNPTNIWGFTGMASGFQSSVFNALNQNYQTNAAQQFNFANTASNNQVQMSNAGGGGGGGCYITTAICESENKPDDCDELIIFRLFRDTYMQENEARKKLIQLYYKDAPDIVAKILSKDNADEMLNYLKTHYLMPSYAAIKSGDYKAAFEKYCDMVYFAATL